MTEAPHSHKMTSWLTVVVIVVASVILGFAFVLKSLPLTAIGGVILVMGIILGAAVKIMDDAF